MDLQIICAECGSEYKASGDAPVWKCPSCGHEAENKKYPFLTRRVAHAKAHRSETNWEEMFDEVLAAAHEKVLALEARLARTEPETKRARGRPPPAP